MVAGTDFSLRFFVVLFYVFRLVILQLHYLHQDSYTTTALYVDVIGVAEHI